MLDLSDYLINKFDKIKNEIFKENIILNKRKITFNFLYQLLNTMFSLVIIAFAMMETLASKLLLGNLMTYINTTGKVESAINNIASSCFSIYTDSTYCEYILSFFRLLEKRERSLEHERIKIDHIKTVELKNVSYKYKNNKEFEYPQTTGML